MPDQPKKQPNMLDSKVGGLLIFKGESGMRNSNYVIGPNGDRWKLVAAKKPGPKPKERRIKELYRVALKKANATKTVGYVGDFKCRSKTIISFFGDLTVDEIDEEYVRAFILSREQLGRKSNTIDLELRCLKRICRVECENWDLPPYITHLGAKKPNLNLRLVDVLPVFDAVGGKDSRTTDIYRKVGAIAVYTGMRLKDICDLKEKNLCRKNWKLSFRQSKVQNILWSRGQNKMIDETVIELSEELKELFQMLPRSLDPESLFFNISRKPLAVAFGRAFKKCGLSGSFHTFRHIAATSFLELGTNIRVVSSLLGHSKIETTMQYLHALDDKKLEAITKHSGSQKVNYGN